MDKCEPITCDPSYFLNKTVDFIQNELTKTDTVRQIGFLKHYIDVSRNAVLIVDVLNLVKVLEHLSENVDEVPEFPELLENLLLLCQLPPVLTKSSDVFTHARDLEEYISMLGVLLVKLKDQHFKRLIFVILNNLLRKSYEEKWRPSLEVRLRAVENSHLPEILAQLIILVEEDMYSEVLSAMVLLVEQSQKCCEKILLEDALNSVCTRFNPMWEACSHRRDNVGSQLTEVLHFREATSVIWQLLRYLRDNQRLLNSLKVINRYSLRSVQECLHFFIKTPDKFTERNNMLALILIFLEFFPKMEFVASGLAKDVASLGMHSGVIWKATWHLRAKLMPRGTDYRCMKLVLAILSYYVDIDGGLRVLEDEAIIYRVLGTVKNYRNSNLWPPAHSCVISIFSLNLLKVLVPYMEEEFIENTGPNILLECLRAHDSTAENLAVLYECLDTLNHILRKEKNGLIMDSILFNNGLAVIFDLCTTLLALPALSNVAQKCLELCFCLAVQLRPNGLNLSAVIVTMSVKAMKKFLNPGPEEQVLNGLMIISLADLIWESIIDSEEFSKMFVEAGSTYLLLDILQTAPFTVQLMLLGLLTDLCEDGDCVPYLMTWKGRKGTTFISLLMEIFRKENKLLEVRCADNGQILDPEYPLMGKTQWIETHCRPEYTRSNPVVADMVLSCRPRIYAILTLLYERHSDKVEMSKEVYKFQDELPPHDQITLLLAENFLALKLGEAWKEVRLELDKLPVKPNQLDSHIMSCLIERSEKWAKHLMVVQDRILKDEHVMNRINEIELYETLVEARLEEALTALSEMKYLSKCTERMFRMSQVYKQQRQIARSRRHKSCGSDVHQTFLKAGVTPVFNQSVSVKTILSAEEDTEDTKLVSAIPSVVEYSIDYNEIPESEIT